MGVSMTEVFNTLQVYLGSLYVNDFNRFGRTWQVNVQADARYRKQVDDLKQLKVRNDRGGMVPLATVAKHPLDQRPGDDPCATTCTPRRRSTATPAPGVSSGEAIRQMEDAAQRQTPAGPRHELRLDRAGHAAACRPATRRCCVFVLAVVLVFLVLAAQYESWSLPLAVILVVPMCLLCSIAGVAVAQHGHQHLHADRLRRAGGPGLQERDPDRRIRQGPARSGRRTLPRPRWPPATSGCGRS